MHVLLDACVALNLEATGEFDAIADALGLTFAMSAKAAQETNYLTDMIDDEAHRTQIDLTLHVRKGTLEMLQLAPGEETITFVRLAERVDDGEAETLALALHRALPYATDDRKAIKVAEEFGLPAPTGTAALLKRYTTSTKLAAHEISTLLNAVERRASFRPPPRSADHSWWLNHS